MSNRVVNNVNSAKFRERNKKFALFASGNLVQIDLNYEYSTVCKLRPVTKNDKGKFTYRDRITFPRSEGLYKWFSNGQIGLFIGRYDGYAVLLIDEGLYACNVSCIKKVEGNNG